MQDFFLPKALKVPIQVVTFRDDEVLSFDKTFIENSGIYRCVAENAHGTDEAEVQVVVVPPPTIYFSQQEVESTHPFEERTSILIS